MQTQIRVFLYQSYLLFMQRRIYLQLALLIFLLAFAATGLVLAEGGTGNSICPGCPNP